MSSSWRPPSEVTGVEVPVGPFSADILAKNSSGEFIIIENEFGKTDHDHLGKILTYAATLNASALVWIPPESGLRADGWV
jgi:hypothetical protein